MKRIIAALLIASTLMLSGCAEGVNVGGKVAPPCGLVNKSRIEAENPEVKYELSAGSVICGIIFCETVIIPIYILGWDLYEAVGKK